MRYPSTKIKGCSSCMLLQLKRQHFTSCPKQAKKMRRSHPQLKLPSLREVLWTVWGEKGKRLNKCTIICLLRINLWLEGEWWAFSIARNFSSIARVWNNGLSASSLAWIWYLSVCTLCMPVWLSIISYDYCWESINLHLTIVGVLTIVYVCIACKNS